MRISTRFLSLTILSIIASCFVLGSRGWAQTPASDRVTWMGVYVSDQKIGYLKMAVRKTTYDGKDALALENTVHTKLKMLGAEMQQDVKTMVYTDLQMKPIHEDFEMSSGGRTTRVEAAFQRDVVKCKVISEGTTTDKSVTIPPGANLMGDSTLYGTGSKKLAVGDKASFYYFNPLSLTIDAVNTEVLRTEKVTLKDKTYDTFVVKNATTMGDVTSWQEDNGDVVKMVALMGMMMVRETEDEALAAETGYRPPSDFAVLTSVKADTDLSKPGQVSRLKLSLVGVGDKTLVISDPRQKATWSEKDGQGTADYTITAKQPNGKASLLMPFRNADLQPYLSEVPYIQSTDPAITRQAAEIVGNEKRAFYAASKIRKWVHEHMHMKADMGVVRSAVDVLNNKSGVCRDYAILYTALARAAGIPTRLVAGLVFFDGSFYYHAWAESYTGEWTPFDATLATDFVDATHIKMTQGDATSMFEIAKVIGGIKAQIVEYQYLEN